MNKYRAWDKEHKKMYKVSTINIEDEYVSLFEKIIYEGEFTRKFNEIILMQSTGLKDKNGVEIFEGDVVKVSNHPFQKKDPGMGVGMEINGNYEVGWNEESLTYVAGTLLLFRLKPYITVIGNIHANPELLKEV